MIRDTVGSYCCHFTVSSSSQYITYTISANVQTIPLKSRSASLINLLKSSYASMPCSPSLYLKPFTFISAKPRPFILNRELSRFDRPYFCDKARSHLWTCSGVHCKGSVTQSHNISAMLYNILVLNNTPQTTASLHRHEGQGARELGRLLRIDDF